ncbi:MAG: DUF1080 domain-containing protein, partial [Bacteroidota bacterium]
MKKYFPLFCLMALLSACTTETATDKADDTATEVEQAPEPQWISLLDSNSAEGWRAYGGDSLPPGWLVENGILTFDTE